jgi:hypothetical protein
LLRLRPCGGCRPGSAASLQYRQRLASGMLGARLLLK